MALSSSLLIPDVLSFSSEVWGTTWSPLLWFFSLKYNKVLALVPLLCFSRNPPQGLSSCAHTPHRRCWQLELLWGSWGWCRDTGRVHLHEIWCTWTGPPWSAWVYPQWWLKDEDDRDYLRGTYKKQIHWWISTVRICLNQQYVSPCACIRVRMRARG